MPLQTQRESAVDHGDHVSLAGMPGVTGSILPQAAAATAAELSANSGYATQRRAATGSRPESASAIYQFFDANEGAFMEAAVDALIPSDATGPGAKELGVATYIDRQLAGAYGKDYRLILRGPLGEGTPRHRDQSFMTPSELIRAGIADIDAHAQETFMRSFDALSTQDRIVILTDLEDDKIELPRVSIAEFFGMLLQLTVEGYLRDPMDGGHEDKADWTLIGFPGASAMYRDKFEPFPTRALHRRVHGHPGSCHSHYRDRDRGRLCGSPLNNLPPNLPDSERRSAPSEW